MECDDAEFIARMKTCMIWESAYVAIRFISINQSQLAYNILAALNTASQQIHNALGINDADNAIED